MEPNTNSSGMMNGMPPVPKESKKVGPIIGILVIVLIVIIAALYFFGKNLNTTAPTNNDVMDTQVVTPTTETNVNNSSSAVNADDTKTIQADLDEQLKDIDYSF